MINFLHASQGLSTGPCEVWRAFFQTPLFTVKLRRAFPSARCHFGSKLKPCTKFSFNHACETVGETVPAFSALEAILSSQRKKVGKENNVIIAHIH